MVDYQALFGEPYEIDDKMDDVSDDAQFAQFAKTVY